MRVLQIGVPEELTSPPYDWEVYIDDVLEDSGTDDTTLLVVSGLPAGLLRVEIQITGAGGCIRTETLIDSIVAGADSVIASGMVLAVPTCEDSTAGAAKATVTQGEAPYLYRLFKDDVLVYSNASNAVMDTATGLAPGDYEWRVSDINTCNVDTVPFTLDPPVGCCEPVCPPDTTIDCGTPTTAAFTGYPTNLDGCVI